MTKHTFNLSISARDDGTLEAAYIQLSSERVAHTQELMDEVVLDFDSEDNLVGVEILAPVKISTVHEVAKVLKAKQRKSFNRFVETYAPPSLVTAE